MMDSLTDFRNPQSAFLNWTVARALLVLAVISASSDCAGPTGPVSIESETLRYTVEGTEGGWRETISIREGDGWVSALHAEKTPTHILAHAIPPQDRADIRVFDMEEPQSGNWHLLSGDLSGPVIRPHPLRHGQYGDGVIDTQFKGVGWEPALTGVLESAPFEALRHYLTMRVAGGGDAHKCRVSVLRKDTGEEIGSLSGKPHPGSGFWPAQVLTFSTVSLDVSAHQGKQLILRVEDDGEGPWDHISLDEVILTDRSPREKSAAVGAATFTIESIHPFTTSKGHPGIRVSALSSMGRILRECFIGDEPDVVHVRVLIQPTANMDLLAFEDRLSFAPARRDTDQPTQGPMDFVWSPLIKAKPDYLSADWTWKSPAVMLQQGPVFAALVPAVNELDRECLAKAPLALDLDVTQDSEPWLSCGVVATKPVGHSYSLRDTEPFTVMVGQPIEFSYGIVASLQPVRLGYRRVIRGLWDWFGRDAFQKTLDVQRNIIHPDLWLFQDWRQEAWKRYAAKVWRQYRLRGKTVGTLVSRRGLDGDAQDDAWFNSWFQTLRTAYGMHLYGARNRDKEAKRRAVQILDLALQAPSNGGLFPSIATFDLEAGKPKVSWVNDNAWAGFMEDYHVFDTSWTAYWMLRWLEIRPEKRKEVLDFCETYAEFLVTHQQTNGCIPSWYRTNLKPREEFREFNAETAGSALFLAELYAATHHERYLAAAQRGMEFVRREVLPRQRWFDYETFKSCSRKPFDFYDPYTAQFPQNNLSTFQAARAYLRLYQITEQPELLSLGEQVLDYALLTQQVWNHPRFSPKLVGGFTTQNTDAEWSDARQCYAAMLLFDYYNATGRLEYLERAVAAARATFAVAPWENWSHTGYTDRPGGMTGFHWGTGSAMTSVEMMTGQLGDAYIHVERAHGVGFNACSVREVRIEDDLIELTIDLAPAWGQEMNFQLRFDGIEQERRYRVAVNGRTLGSFPGHQLSDMGMRVPVSFLR